MSDYEPKAMTAAKAQSLSADDIQALGYVGIAALAGVKIEVNGDSPADFFYINVRNYVVNRLDEEEKEAAEAAMQQAVMGKLTAEQKDWLADKLEEATGTRPVIVESL